MPANSFTDVGGYSTSTQTHSQLVLSTQVQSVWCGGTPPRPWSRWVLASTGLAGSQSGSTAPASVLAATLAAVSIAMRAPAHAPSTPSAASTQINSSGSQKRYGMGFPTTLSICIYKQ
ncbi:hypothetical protein D3C81_1822730 [compost metagenome]